MRKLLYIPYSQDGFLPSCFSPLSCSGSPPLHNLLCRSLFTISQAFQKNKCFFACCPLLFLPAGRLNFPANPLIPKSGNYSIKMLGDFAVYHRMWVSHLLHLFFSIQCFLIPQHVYAQAGFILATLHGLKCR